MVSRQWLNTDVRVWTPGLLCLRSLLHHNMDLEKELGLELVLVVVQMVKGCCDIAVVKESPLCKEVQVRHRRTLSPWQRASSATHIRAKNIYLYMS